MFARVRCAGERGWRARWSDEPGDIRTVSAERGHLHDVGNLVFHLSLLSLLVAFALGKLFGYEGQVIVMSGGGQFCNTGILGYDENLLVSSDFKGNPLSSIVDAPLTKVIGQSVKVLSWYDNEWGYSNRVVDLIGFLESKGL